MSEDQAHEEGAVDRSVFTLEAIDAGAGDCFLVHFGTTTEPKLVLIDGGTGTTYTQVLAKRLKALRNYLFEGEPARKLELEAVVVSHLDSDHLNGILYLFRDLTNGHIPVAPKHLLFNSYASAVPSIVLDPEFVRATIETAAYPQADELTEKAMEYGVPFLSLVSSGHQEAWHDVAATVVAPTEDQLEELAEEWRDWERKRKPSDVELAGYVDARIPNLTSIVLLLERGQYSMLMTGDARGDHILEALGIRYVGTRHVSILKLPHHGSRDTLAKDFFEKLTADHYVISGRGEHHPAEEVLRSIVESRGEERFTIWLTNANSAVEELIASRRGDENWSIKLRGSDAPSIEIDLSEPSPLGTAEMND